jgi:hypothetical protein
MKRWAFVVAGLYVLILAVLTVPVGLLAFAPKARLTEVAEAYVSFLFWLWLGVMGLAQAALLVVPVRLASRRPLSRRSLLWPVTTAGLMMGGLATGAVYSVGEFIARGGLPGWFAWAGIFCGIIFWCLWAMWFYLGSRNAEPENVVSRQCQLMLRGSILELLVAVPTHIVARSRDYCCAGFMTFIGLSLGISVMLFSFGPSVFFLYVARWRRLHPEP